MTGTIQTGIDLLPATGAMVKLLDGTYNIATGLVLDSYQTLKGCGKNTIFTTATADLDIITATGSSGSEKTGILLADFCIDGDAGGETNDTGILWQYVDDSKISNCWVLDNGEYGILLENSDSSIISGNTCYGNVIGIYPSSSSKNIITSNTCENNSEGIYVASSNGNIIASNTCCGNVEGIWLAYSLKNVVIGNTCENNDKEGICFTGSSSSTVTGNTCQGNSWEGILLASSSNKNVVVGNTCEDNDRDGISLYSSDDNTVIGNTLTENSQGTTNTSDDIYLDDSDYNNIQGNTCRAGGETNKPRYGINISNATCNENKVINNDLYDDGFVTGAYNDDGTDTIYVEPGIDDTPVNGEIGQPISSNWAYDHNAALLSTTVHNNNNYFLGYGNETVTDPTQNAVVRIPALTAITDPASGLDVSDWYGASGAYRQADADSDATHIEDDDASFPASMQFTLVKWASNAAGDADVGIGYVSSVTDSDTLVIAKFTGADFAASYYYWIKHSEWVVPVTGIYYIKAAVLFLPSEADKRFEARIWYYTGTSAPAQLLQGVASSGLTDYEFPTISGIVTLTANDHLFAIGQHSGTSGTPNIYTGHVAHLPLQAFLLKQTA